ncbi:MAG: ABC transporter substrate-binding protein [Treponema sp.]|nr:ABC transporter substrate-binding protein [Candidatus Treponema equifaecale]
MKRFCSFFIISIFSALLFGAPKSVKIGVLTGTSGYGCAHMIENKSNLSIKNLGFEVYNSSQAVIAKLLNGQLEIGFVTPLQAAKIFNKDKEMLVVLGTAQESNLAIITSDQDYSSIFSLKEKKILCTGQNEEAEILMKTLLKKNEIQSELDFETPAPEIVSALISKNAEYALLEEPYATWALQKSPELRRAATISNLLEKAHPSMVMIANARFVRTNRETVNKIIEAYKKSWEWAERNPVQAGALAKKYKLTLNQKMAEKAVAKANYVWKDADITRKDIENLIKLSKDANPESFTGKVPSESFYYQR